MYEGVVYACITDGPIHTDVHARVYVYKNSGGRGGYNRFGRGGRDRRGRVENRKASVNVEADWSVVEEVDLPQLTKLQVGACVLCVFLYLCVGVDGGVDMLDT